MTFLIFWIDTNRRFSAGISTKIAPMKNFLTWTPRIVLIAYSIFISVFALDAFSEEGSFFHRLGDFLMHLAPSVVVLLMLFLAWRFPLIGGLFVMILGMIFTIYFHTNRTFSYFMMISAPLFVAGLLFIFSHAFIEKSELV